MIDDKYRAILEIYKCLNITQAAHRLNLQQGSVSKILKKVEEEIGEKLFVRTPKKLVPTSFCISFVEILSMHLRQWDQQLNVLKKQKLELAGHFRIGCHPVVAYTALKNSFSIIQEKYPLIELELEFAHSASVVDRVVSGDLDIGVAAISKKHPDLIIKKLYTEEVKIYGFDKKNKSTILYYYPEMVSIKDIILKNKKMKLVPVKDYFIILNLLKNNPDHVGLLPSKLAESNPDIVAKSNSFYDIDISMVYRFDIPISSGFLLLQKILQQT